MTLNPITCTPYRNGILLLVLLSHGLVAPASAAATAAERQVQERVRENVDYFMNAPVLATSLHSDFYDLGGFPHGLQAPDRDLALQYMFSQVKTRRLKVYYGMETGVFLGYGDDFSFATNREPGESGYLVNENSTDVDKYWNTCVNRDTGQPEECRMSEGAKYVACKNECELVPCANQGNGSSLEKKWCRNYTIEKVQANEVLARGYIPRTYHCINAKGQFTQAPGQALQSGDSSQTGDCTFRDGTLVTREIAGPFAYCGGNNTTCSTTYTGTYRSRDYDPRYRTWYLDAAAAQHHLWSDPYTFFSTGDIGITWADPIYSIDALGQQIFEGILAVDYPLDAISDFLVDAYADKTNTLVAIFEDRDPHYVVGVSTGTKTTKKVLKDDPTKPCPTEDTDKECEMIRLPLAELDETDDDKVFQNALEALEEAGFPEDSFVSVTVLDDHGQSAGYYSALSIIYEHPNANLKWRIVVANPIQRNPANAIAQGQSLFFLPLCLTGGLGFAVCTALFVMYYRRRSERAVIFSDFRFTSAFIFGCALLNLTTFTLLGENTDELCMLRMWSFHLLFALALSPLFVKVYRLWKLTGDTSTAGMQRRRRISNLQAALYTVPIPAVQGVILLLVSLLDPPVETETMEWEGGSLVPNVLCSSETDAFLITQLVFDVSLVCVGCFLAFLTRNMDEKFGEPKQLLFSMYNIAFTGVILIVLFVAVDIEQDGKRMLQAIGVFWATVISSAAFVVPRLMQANLSRGGSSHHGTSRYAMTRVSGLPLNTEHSAHSHSGSGCNPNQTPTEEFTAESQPMDPPLTP